MGTTIEFRKSGKTVQWDDAAENILELAEDNDIAIDSECMAGVCGTCKTRLLAGKVDMETDDGLEEEDRQNNMILPCVATPVTDVVLDA